MNDFSFVLKQQQKMLDTHVWFAESFSQGNENKSNRKKWNVTWYNSTIRIMYCFPFPYNLRNEFVYSKF